MLILILIDAQYLQNVVLKKVGMVKTTPPQIPTTRQKNPPSKIFPTGGSPLPLNAIWKNLRKK